MIRRINTSAGNVRGFVRAENFCTLLHDLNGIVDFSFPSSFPSPLAHEWTINCCVNTVGGEFPLTNNEFPSPFNGVFFEIIAETPVAEHLEKCVVIGVEADVVEVVVLAAGADALLRVRRATGRVGALGLAKEDGHELVHAGVREQ